MTIETS